MTIGDLVSWTEGEALWDELFCPGPDSFQHRQRGIILSTNDINFFVLWENGEFLCTRPDSLKVISEARRFG